MSTNYVTMAADTSFGKCNRSISQRKKGYSFRDVLQVAKTAGIYCFNGTITGIALATPVGMALGQGDMGLALGAICGLIGGGAMLASKIEDEHIASLKECREQKVSEMTQSREAPKERTPIRLNSFGTFKPKGLTPSS